MNHRSQITNYDICLVGVGGQGVLTISDLITEAATHQEIPVSSYPTKGMAQRGGFVKVQLRLGRQTVGPNIPEKGADLVIAMELSEALKAVRFTKPGADFLLFGHVWMPTAVMLGEAPYPTLDQVKEQVQQAGAKLYYLDPVKTPLYEGRPIASNIYVLGAAAGHTGLRKVVTPSALVHTIQERWKKATERNTFAFQSGMEATVTG